MSNASTQPALWPRHIPCTQKPMLPCSFPEAPARLSALCPPTHPALRPWHAPAFPGLISSPVQLQPVCDPAAADPLQLACLQIPPCGLWGPLPAILTPTVSLLLAAPRHFGAPCPPCPVNPSRSPLFQLRSHARCCDAAVVHHAHSSQAGFDGPPPVLPSKNTRRTPAHQPFPLQS